MSLRGLKKDGRFLDGGAVARPRVEGQVGGADVLDSSCLPGHSGGGHAGSRDSMLGVFLIWTACNPLKSLESDEGIQENPSPFSWSGLVWIWVGLEKFGLRRSARGRRPLAPGARLPIQMAQPVARDGRSPGDRKPGNGAASD